MMANEAKIESETVDNLTEGNNLNLAGQAKGEFSCQMFEFVSNWLNSYDKEASKIGSN